MVGAKIAHVPDAAGLGAGNFLLVERLRADPATSVNRLRRFAEVEFGIGIAIFFAAASLTSVPPAVDLHAGPRLLAGHRRAQHAANGRG